MEPYQQRVVTERDELKAKLDKLRAFLSGPMTLELHEDEHERLWLQLGLMVGYERVLSERINVWAVTPLELVTHVAARDGQPERIIPMTKGAQDVQANKTLLLQA